MSKPVKIPGPDHPIGIESNPDNVTIRVGDATVAQTNDALLLQEATYPPVQYIPRVDVDMAALRPSDHTTYCPYKGDASYFHILSLGERGRNAVWSYEAPYDAVAQIAGHLAFYEDRVTVTEA